MPLSKVCTKCDAVAHIKKSMCVCGHTFRMQRKAEITPKNGKRLEMR